MLSRRFPDALTKAHWQPSHGFVLRAAAGSKYRQMVPAEQHVPTKALKDYALRPREARSTAFTKLIADSCARVQARAVAQQERVVARAVEATLLDCAEAEAGAVRAAVAACKAQELREREAAVARALKFSGEQVPLSGSKRFDWRVWRLLIV